MRKLLLLAAILGLVMQVTVVRADEEDDEAFEGSMKTAASSTRQRNYVGGRDEQNIEVQTSLAQPARAADAIAASGESSHSDD